MNHLLRFLLVIAGLTASPLSAAQLVTNNINVSLTLAFQQSDRENATSFFTPAPRTQTFTTRDLILQMSKSFPEISTNRGTALQVVSAIDEENAPVIFQVKNTNGVITPIPSSVLSVSNGAVSLYSYTSPKNGGVVRSSNLGLLTVFYDDTTTEANQSTNGLRFSFSGVSTFSTTLTPTRVANSYLARQTVSQSGAMGEGFLAGVDTNDPTATTGFVITRASLTATGTNTVTILPQE